MLRPTVLDETLRAAYVPPDRLCSEHLVCAANLMAKEGLAPADAYERVVLQSARRGGLVEPDEWQDFYGFGAGGEALPGWRPQHETPEQRDLKRWPVTQAPMNAGRETGPFDSGAFAPAAAVAMPSVMRSARDGGLFNLPNGRTLTARAATLGSGGRSMKKHRSSVT